MAMTKDAESVTKRRIGVLALQGGFEAHERRLTELGHEPVRVRYAAQFGEIDGLILPGGESTTHLKLIALEGLGPALEAFVATRKPVLATCAGLILSAKTVTGPAQASFGFLDVAVRRNAWGRQLDSFEAVADDSDVPLTFIRAPRIESVGAGVEVVLRYRGEPVLVRTGAFFGATFHPELTADVRVHRQVFGGAVSAAPVRAG
jgi:5'-phosphate synthase pdxT subunit